MKKDVHLSFSLEEYHRRLAATRERMQRDNLDLIILNSPDNITYLTGYQTSGYGTFGALLVPLEEEPFMVTRLLEVSNVETRTWLSRAMTYADYEDPLQVMNKAVEKFCPQVKNIGIEKDCFYLTFTRQKKLIDMWQDKKILNCSGLVEPIRAVKSKAELELLKKAAHATEQGMLAGIAATKVGVSENDIAADVHAAMFRAGGEYPAVPPYITSGPRTIIGHATWEGRKVKENENVFIEIGGCYRRYHTAMMRTIYLGAKPPVELVEAAKIVNEDLDTLMQAMKPGVSAGEIATLTGDSEKLAKIGATRISRVGYSMGIAYAPSWDEGHIISLVEGSETLLEENMVFHLIPWLQLPSLQTVMGLSETVQVGPSGAKSLFSLEREYIIKH